jgi:hypothetical protein
MELRRELDLINKHFRNHFNKVGETVVYYEFLKFSEQGSVYDDIYDEGSPSQNGKKYKPGVVLPALLASEAEDFKRSIPEGRQMVQNISLFIPIKDMRDAGISNPWEYQPHLNDMFSYDGRFYGIYQYRVRGRLRDEVFVLIEGNEIYVDQEMVNDLGPDSLYTANIPWPADLPIIG